MTPAVPADARSHAPALRYDGAALRAALLRRADIGEADWRIAQEVARQNATSELRALLDLGLIGEDTLAQRLCETASLPRWSPSGETGVLSSAVPTEFMALNGVLVLEEADVEVGAAPSVRIVVSDPSDHFACASLLSRFGRSAEVVIGTHKEIEGFLSDQAAPAAAEASGPEESVDVSGELTALRDMASEAPVVRFFNQTVERAMDLGASDIHLERFERRVSLRFRVDGMLIEQPPPPLRLFEPILCRIKIMSNLDIAERRRAQDGRIRMRLRGRAVDMRVSIVPTTYGQDAAIRLQDRQRLADIDLESLGFSRRNVTDLMGVASKAHGILLITGPTGSGKTTTLYSILRRLISSERKIVTVEDPVEYAMDGVNQIQVNNTINLSFSNTLRHILRHDPDVILIGEIRDRETAEIAFQASLTGHMVLSTLHTNDVPGTFVRLIDMGVEPFLVNAAVEGVSAQRLLRTVCTACRNHTPARDACETCGGIGYRGRVAVMEFARMLPEVKRCLLQGADEHRIRESLLQSGYLPLRAEAQRLVDEGRTDDAEVVRVLGARGAETLTIDDTARGDAS